jgi:alpha-amylase
MGGTWTCRSARRTLQDNQPVVHSRWKSASSGLVSSRYLGRPDEVLLQGFHWESCKTKWRSENPLSWYEIMRQNAGRIRAAGFTFVWFPPPCPATSPDGEGYEPTRWHCFDSSYGLESELRAAIRALRGTDGAGPRAMVDVVINHRCGTTDWGDFSEPDFAGPGEHSPEEIARANLLAIAPDDTWRRVQDVSLPEPTVQSGYEQTEAGRHLDHANPLVAAEVKKWLKNYLLDDLGFAGFRYDFAAGYPARCIGRYNDHARPEMSVGEVWREDADQLFQWVCGTREDSHRSRCCVRRQTGKSAAFDFALRAKLWEALRQDDFAVLRTPGGKPPGLIGVWPEAAVTFIENHDMEPVRGNEKAFPHDKILAGYAYILTHPGKPCVFWRHFFDYGYDEFQQSFESIISRMIGLRKQNVICSGSRCKIVAAERSLYAAIIDDRLAVKIGSSLAWSPGPGWTSDPVCWGRDFAIWTRAV